MSRPACAWQSDSESQASVRLSVRRISPRQVIIFQEAERPTGHPGFCFCGTLPTGACAPQGIQSRADARPAMQQQLNFLLPHIFSLVSALYPAPSQFSYSRGSRGGLGFTILAPQFSLKYPVPVLESVVRSTAPVQGGSTIFSAVSSYGPGGGMDRSLLSSQDSKRDNDNSWHRQLVVSN